MITRQEFRLIRLFVYVSLIISFVLLKFMIDVNCRGCLLCGMTRAITCLITVRFVEAYEYNQCSVLFIPIMIAIVLDMGYILYGFVKKFR